MNRQGALAIAMVCWCLADLEGFASNPVRNSNTAQSATALPARVVAQRVLPHVVTLIVETTHGRAIGSGFFVGNGVVVTNYHVIESATSGTAKLVDESKSFRIEGAIEVDKTHDLALISVPEAHITPLKLGSTKQLGVGDVVYAVGSPEGLEGTFSQGNVSGKRKFASGYRLQITAPISQGSSGGPVLDSYGQVIGVSQALSREGQNLNFAIPVSYLADLITKGMGNAVTSLPNHASAYWPGLTTAPLVPAAPMLSENPPSNLRSPRGSNHSSSSVSCHPDSPRPSQSPMAMAHPGAPSPVPTAHSSSFGSGPPSSSPVPVAIAHAGGSSYSPVPRAGGSSSSSSFAPAAPSPISIGGWPIAVPPSVSRPSTGGAAEPTQDVFSITIWSTYTDTANKAMSSQQYAQAEKFFKLAIKEAKKAGFPSAAHRQSSLDLASCYFKQEKYAAAEPLYKWFVSTEYPFSDAVVLGNLGIINRKKGKNAEAENYFKQALAIDERDPQRNDRVAWELLNLSNIYRESGRSEEATALDQKRQSLLTPSRVEVQPVGPSMLGFPAHVDFDPYVSDLARRIRRAWIPPKTQEFHRVSVVFKIHRGGELSHLRLDQSSGLAIEDQAALKAVENAAPFRPLPNGASEAIDGQITFEIGPMINTSSSSGVVDGSPQSFWIRLRATNGEFGNFPAF